MELLSFFRPGSKNPIGIALLFLQLQNRVFAQASTPVEALMGIDVATIEIQDSTQEGNRDSEVSVLDLDQLIEFAKKNNPLYQAAKQNIQLAEGDLVSAGLFPNPQLSYSQSFIGGLRGSEGGSAEYAPGLNWEVDLFGKRLLRQLIAEKGVSIEKLTFADFDRLFQLQLRLCYREFLLLTEQIEYKKEFFSNYMNLLEASKIRQDKGDISKIEYDRLDLERITYEGDYRATDLKLIEVSQRLRRLLGVPASQSSLPIKGHLHFVPLNKLPAFKRKINPEKRPDFAALLQKVEQADSLASLKTREIFPNFNLGGEYRKKANESYFGFSISFPFPVFNRNQGEIFKAEELGQKLKLEASAKKEEIKAELQTRINELSSREKMLLKYEELGLLEKNKKVAESSRFAYLKKAYSIVALLESQRNFINVQKSYYEQVYLYYTSIDAFLAASAEGEN